MVKVTFIFKSEIKLYVEKHKHNGIAAARSCGIIGMPLFATNGSYLVSSSVEVHSYMQICELNLRSLIDLLAKFCIIEIAMLRRKHKVCIIPLNVIFTFDGPPFLSSLSRPILPKS